MGPHAPHDAVMAAGPGAVGATGMSGRVGPAPARAPGVGAWRRAAAPWEAAVSPPAARPAAAPVEDDGRPHTGRPHIPCSHPGQTGRKIAAAARDPCLRSPSPLPLRRNGVRPWGRGSWQRSAAAVPGLRGGRRSARRPGACAVRRRAPSGYMPARPRQRPLLGQTEARQGRPATSWALFDPPNALSARLAGRCTKTDLVPTSPCSRPAAGAAT
jgi:hypothetical protein